MIYAVDSLMAVTSSYFAKYCTVDDSRAITIHPHSNLFTEMYVNLFI